MKKIVIVGAGTAGLICAGIVNRFWEDDVQVKVIYNSQSKNIAVGESTTPIVHQALDIFQLRTEDLVNRSNTTVKLGVNFKDWIPGEEYFHGLLETRLLDFNQLVRNDDSSSIHCLLNDIKIKTSNYYQATTTIPGDEFYEYSHSLHIDTQELSKLLFEKLELEDNVEFIDDIVENVNVDGENIASIECKKSGNIDADLFIDASGFNCVLFKHLNPNGLILHIFYRLIVRYLNKFQWNLIKFQHIPFQKQLIMGGFGEYHYKIGMEQGICILRSLHLTKKHGKNLMIG